ncbi:MAG: response regulator [Nitrospirae bacterium]|nr:response regulator [Nitrospirota bacterium]
MPKRTLLFVDDEEDILDAMYDTFKGLYNVRIAGSAEEALRIFNEEDIAVVISDQRMPHTKGSELLAEINRIKPHCKKILLTGYADISASIDAINKGSVNKYITKPCDKNEIIDAIEQLVELYNVDEFMVKSVLSVSS